MDHSPPSVPLTAPPSMHHSLAKQKRRGMHCLNGAVRLLFIGPAGLTPPKIYKLYTSPAQAGCSTDTSEDQARQEVRTHLRLMVGATVWTTV